jgi:hypothetical protein
MLRRITSRLSRISPDEYILVIVVSLIVLSSANLLFCALMYDFGFGATPYTSPFSGPAGPADRFADLVKVSFSYRPFVSGISVETVQSWPAIYRSYFTHPRYRGIGGLAEGRVITHFHQPPLTTLLFLGDASLISRTQNITLALVVSWCGYLATVQWALLVGIPAKRRTLAVSLGFWFIALVSYPALMVFTRGNFQSGFTTMFIAAFMFSLFLRKRPELWGLLSLAVAVNFRPNAVLFIVAIPLVIGLRRSIRPIFYFGALAGSIFSACYLAVNWLYPDYTLSTFLQGLSIYKKLYVIGNGGDAGNCSLWALLKNFGRIDADYQRMALILPLFAMVLAALFWRVRRLQHWTVMAPFISIIAYAEYVAITGSTGYLYWAYSLLALYLAVAVCWELWHCTERMLVAPFVLTAGYCLLCPIFAEYHLLVFFVPMLMLYFNHREWANNFRLMAVIGAGCVLMLSPKNYIYVAGISFQTLVNPLILFFLTLYVARGNCQISRTQVESCESDHLPVG